MNIVIGALIVAATVYLLLQRYEFRMVLLASGLLLAGIALDPLTVLDEFAYKMVTDSLIQAVCSSLGFAYVMKITGCEAHLLTLVGRRLSGLGGIAIPVVTLLTFAINSILMSAGNTAAAAGIVFVPLLVRAGVVPAVAAAAVLAGTFGSMLNPALPTNAFVARVAAAKVQFVAASHGLPVTLAVVIAALCLTLLALWRKEHCGYAQAGSEDSPVDAANPLYATIPLIPLAILVLGGSGLVPVLRIGIAQAMLVGALLGLLVTRSPAAKITEEFFSGMGSAYAQVMGMIIAVAVFVSGMKSIGLVSFFITWLTTTPQIAKAGGVFGPFLMAIMTGSGDAAAFAFSEAVAPHAFLYGMSTVQMGSIAAIAGALGRTMSPLAGATIVCATLAGVNPLELVKRNCPGMCLALLVAFWVI